MKTYYQTDLNKAYLIIEGEDYQEEDYRIQVLKENYLSGMIAPEVRYIDNVQKYYFDITGKTSVKQIYERNKPGFEELKKLMESLLCVIYTLRKHMVGSEGLLLDPELIFQEKGKHYFCFCPLQERMLTECFHELTEFLVREVDYQDEKGVHLAYVMHKATMEENYSLEQIMQEFREEFLQEMEICEEAEEVSYQSSVPQPEESMVAEKKDWKESVRRLIEKTRMRL